MKHNRGSNSIKLFIPFCILIFSNFNIAQNVILFISDGCGYNHIEAASIYEFGEEGKQL